MPSFEDMQKLYQNIGTHGQQLKVMADEIMQQTFDTDIGTRQCYIYDYYHDDQFDEGLSGYNPALSKTKIPVKLKFIVKTYKSMAKDDPEYHIQFEPDVYNSMSCKSDWFVRDYERLGIDFPISLFVDIPDDRGVYQKWLITYREDANQFPKFGVIKCNYLFTWVTDDGVHDITVKCGELKELRIRIQVERGEAKGRTPWMNRVNSFSRTIKLLLR